MTARLSRPVRGALDQAQAQMAITSAEDRGVLAVPITAVSAVSAFAAELARSATVAAWLLRLELANIRGSRMPSTTPSTRTTAAAVTRT